MNLEEQPPLCQSTHTPGLSGGSESSCPLGAVSISLKATRSHSAPHRGNPSSSLYAEAGAVVPKVWRDLLLAQKLKCVTPASLHLLPGCHPLHVRVSTGSGDFGSKFGIIINQLCDLGPVPPLWASILPHLDDPEIPSQL